MFEKFRDENRFLIDLYDFYTVCKIYWTFITKLEVDNLFGLDVKPSVFSSQFFLTTLTEGI